MIPLSWYLILAAGLFSIGLFGVLVRRNAVAILLGVELMLNAVNINLVAFWRYGDISLMAGQVFAIIVSLLPQRKWLWVWLWLSLFIAVAIRWLRKILIC